MNPIRLPNDFALKLKRFNKNQLLYVIGEYFSSQIFWRKSHNYEKFVKPGNMTASDAEIEANKYAHNFLDDVIKLAQS